jgi:hypothetical protein
LLAALTAPVPADICTAGGGGISAALGAQIWTFCILAHGEGHAAICGLGAPAGSRPGRLRISDARDGFGICGCGRAAQSMALRLVAPGRCRAEKKVRNGHEERGRAGGPASEGF